MDTCPGIKSRFKVHAYIYDRADALANKPLKKSQSQQISDVQDRNFIIGWGLIRILKLKPPCSVSGVVAGVDLQFLSQAATQRAYAIDLE